MKSILCVLFANFFYLPAVRADLKDFPELKAPIIATETKEDLKELQVLHGRILPYAEIPALYEIVTKVFR